MKTHWRGFKGGKGWFTVCCHAASAATLLVDDEDALTCLPCRKKRGLPAIDAPPRISKRELQDWDRDPTQAFDVECIRGLIAEVRALKAECDLFETQFYQYRAKAKLEA